MSYQAPPWQAPPRRTGWNDPRLSQPQQTPTPGQQHQYQQHQPPTAQSPISPINPQAFAYLPPEHQQPAYNGPPATAGQYDTSTWGVKYKQHQGQPPQWQQPAEDRPPLPPRPSSALHSHQPSQTAIPDQWQQGYSSQAPTQQLQQQHQQQPSWPNAYGTPPTYNQSVPPPPPPKPHVYETQTQQQHYQQPNLPQDHYSNQPPTHHYEPQRPVGEGQQQYSAPQHQYSLHAPVPGPLQDAAPVSPIEPEPHKWPAQQPHYGLPQPSVMQAPATPGEDKFYSTALGPYGGPSDWEHFGDGNTVSPEVSSPPQVHATPAMIAPRVSASPPPMAPRTSDPGPATDPSRPPQTNVQSSDTSSVTSGNIKRTDTIDGVINAWSAPLKFGSKPSRIDESRPQSSGSIQESPKERVVEVIKEVTKVVDPYQDMEPEFKASLKRYADMLRKEAAAETDEEKFAAFEAFIKKELRLRAMLYGMDSPLQLIKTQERGSQSAERPKEVSQPAVPPPVVDPSPAEPVKELKKSEETSPPAPPPAKPAPEAQAASRAAEPVAEPANERPTQPPAEPPSKSITAGLNLAALAAQLKDSPVKDSSQKDDSFVMVNRDADDDDQEFSPGGRPKPTSKPTGTEEAYSPGGRPIPSTSKPTRSLANPKNEVPELSIPYMPPSRPAILSPGANAPMVLEDYVMPGSNNPYSPGANAPMLVEPPTPSPQSASANAPIVVDSSSFGGMSSKRSSTASTKKFEPERPAYMPFRYSPAVQGPSMPADKSYSSLRKDGVESGRFLKHDPTSVPRAATPASGSAGGGLAPIAALQPGGGKKMQDEAFIGLIRQQSKGFRGGAKPPFKPSGSLPPIPQLRPGTPAARAQTPGAAAGAHPTSRTPTPAAVPGLGAASATANAVSRPTTPAGPPAPTDLPSALALLRTSLPSTVPDSYGLSTYPLVNTIKSAVDALPDQFGFIHATVVEWDARNRTVRKRLDEERSQREKDSEARIDDMFNDNEIGYADIGELESEFKLAEARRKYDEDKSELDQFTGEVYESVVGRVRGELGTLGREYEKAIGVLEGVGEPAGRFLLLGHSDGAAGVGGGVVGQQQQQQPPAAEMGIVMNLVLAIYNKMELRYQKLAEAAVERERRRKRLELTVLYTNGDTAGVRRLESEFAIAERMAVLQEARARNVRANTLMDAFDRAVVRGLGDNQGFVDELLPRIRGVREFVFRETTTEEDVLYGPTGVRETLATAQKALDFVLADSQKLLTIENVADKLLNDADYGVSVAEARVSEADRSTYQKLGEEKEKEDAKIVEDTGSRMSAVGKGPEEAVELIREVVARIGDDPEHQGRIKRALEAAKMRNEGVGEGGS